MAEIVFGNERMVVPDDMTIEDAVISLGKHPDAFLYLCDGRPVPMTVVIDGMKIEALRVASGG